MTDPAPVRRLTVSDVARMHADGEPIAMLTAYDTPTAELLDEAGIPILLVGDSVGQVMLGYETTVRVSMGEMLHHTAAVVRGTRRALVVGDLPFLSYGTVEHALENAGRFLRDAGAQAVKLEGGVRVAPVVSALVGAGVPVMGHVGLTPQAIHAIGKVRVQGRSAAQARQVIEDAEAVAAAGAFAIVLELIPEQLAAEITRRLPIPTIGIGAGAGCSGQVQVFPDLVGLASFVPRHARPYANLRGAIREAAVAWAADVADGTFPGPEQASRMDDDALRQALDGLDGQPGAPDSGSGDSGPGDSGPGGSGGQVREQVGEPSPGGPSVAADRGS